VVVEPEALSSVSPSLVTATTTTTATTTATLAVTSAVKATHRLPDHVEDVAADAVAADATVQIAALAVGVVAPDSAMTLLRLSGLSPRADCSARWGANSSLGWMHSPTQLAIGAGDGRYHVGAIVGNFSLVAAVVAAFALASFLVPDRFLVGDASTEQVAGMSRWRRAARRFATSRGTQFVLSAAVVLLPPTAASALTLLGASSSGWAIFAAVVALVVVLATVAAATQLFRDRYFEATFVDAPAETTDGPAPCYGAVVHRFVRSQMLAPGDWCNVADTTFFFDLWGPLFWDYRQPRRWYYCVELALSVALAAAAFLGEIFGCLTGAFAGLAVTIGALALLLWLRPHARNLERSIAVLTYVLLLAVACCNVAYHLTGRGDGARDAAVALVTALSIFCLLFATYQVVALALKVRQSASVETHVPAQLVPLFGMSPADLMGGEDSDSDSRLEVGSDTEQAAPPFRLRRAPSIVLPVPATAPTAAAVVLSRSPPALPPSTPPPSSPTAPRVPSPLRAAEPPTFGGFVTDADAIEEARNTLPSDQMPVACTGGRRRRVPKAGVARRVALEGSEGQAQGFALPLLCDDVEMDDVPVEAEVDPAEAEAEVAAQIGEEDDSDDSLL
jgi:membrane protein YdbS with pleckstrin-like domain